MNDHELARPAVRRYRTEILIPPDRYVSLQLPAHLPEGRAIITVTIEEPHSDDVPDLPDLEADCQDIEWWDEFQDPTFDDPHELRARSARG